MLLSLVQWIVETFGDFKGAGLVQYITFRAGIASILSLVISMAFGGRIIRYLHRLQVGETVRDLGLKGQLKKQGTPTMGGVIIIMAILIPCLLLADLQNVYIVLLIVSTVWMAAIGFVDDYIKVFKKNKEGLRGSFKVLGQIGLGLLIALTMIAHEDVVVRLGLEEANELGYTQMVGDTIGIPADSGLLPGPANKADYKTNLTNVPFLKGNRLDYAWLVPLPSGRASRWVWLLFVPLVIFIVTAVSNAANLTDGLDGLATGVSGIIGAALGIFAYVSGNAIAANYLNILHLPGTGEIVIFSACFVGACLGFLWYNSFPCPDFYGRYGKPDPRGHHRRSGYTAA